MKSTKLNTVKSMLNTNTDKLNMLSAKEKALLKKHNYEPGKGYIIKLHFPDDCKIQKQKESKELARIFKKMGADHFVIELSKSTGHD